MKEQCHKFNQLSPGDARWKEILSELVCGNSDYIFIESGFQCALGKNIHFKGMAMLNFNCTLLDTRTITIGH